MNDVGSFQDKAGVEVRVGDFICYGHAMGRCAGLRFGKVLSIKTGKDYRDRDEWSIRVNGVDDDWDGFFGLRLCKPGTLMFPSRILNANSFIPQKYKDLFEAKEMESQ